MQTLLLGMKMYNVCDVMESLALVKKIRSENKV